MRPTEASLWVADVEPPQRRFSLKTLVLWTPSKKSEEWKTGLLWSNLWSNCCLLATDYVEIWGRIASLLKYLLRYEKQEKEWWWLNPNCTCLPGQVLIRNYLLLDDLWKAFHRTLWQSVFLTWFMDRSPFYPNTRTMWIPNNFQSWWISVSKQVNLFINRDWFYLCILLNLDWTYIPVPTQVKNTSQIRNTWKNLHHRATGRVL